MPGINVIDSDGDIQRFPDATTWHVDDRGQLHLNNTAGQVASFAKDCWRGAGSEDETNPPSPRRATLEDVVKELQAIRHSLVAGNPKVVGDVIDRAAGAGRRRSA